MNHIKIDTNNKTNTQRIWINSMIWTIFLIYLGLLFYVTLFAWNYGSSYGPLGPGGRNYNLVPLRSIHNILYYSPNLKDPILILGGNIIMFIPFGVLTTILISKKKRALWLVPLLSIFLSSFVEMNQFIFTQRVSNIDDVLLNTLGGLLGAWCTLIIIWMIRKAKNRIFIFKE